ncbi:membrane protein insertase YidC [Ligilactobacillus sp. WILCCON 0076]|uniref:Membrane protein insertase YidC n=1 Tax=Ligilactobacillus ubinensis TaxID=2876789 RepID=A0A9X2JLJ9_9LACO|nr:membrane protein insertase YidC [Ligilactobacillus ubinensis]MCP0887082.1 membrane protein insertase YidC [Ligilactobacillus ubinensis]
MKRGKRIVALLGALSLVFVLAGCSSTTPITSKSTGFWDHYIIWNFIRAIEGLSGIFGHNYGWGIVIFTVIVRIIILPLMIYQTKSARKTSELQPQLKKLQAKYPGRDTESMTKLREEQQKLYKEAGVNPVAGCLPLLVQMPILIALYQAIFRSETLKAGHFMWMELGDKDPYYILPILAAVFTFVTSKLSMMSQPEQNMMTSTMTYGMPVMIFVMAINVPAALSLYWVITNAFSAGQTLLINNPFKINREREEKIRVKKDQERKLAKAKRKALKGKKRN